MTQDMMTLRALLEKSSDADLLREMIGFTAERLMALEVEGLTGAAHGERSADRITCQWRSKKGPPRRCKKGPLGGCGLVPVVHGSAPRATRRALNRPTRRRAREGPVAHGVKRGLGGRFSSPSGFDACGSG